MALDAQRLFEPELEVTPIAAGFLSTPPIVRDLAKDTVTIVYQDVRGPPFRDGAVARATLPLST